MRRTTNHRIAWGAGVGVVAGLFLLGAQVGVAGARGEPVLAPFGYAASVVLGRMAVDASSSIGVVIAALIVHVAISAALGIVYALANGWMATETRTRWSRQAILGTAYGGLVWLVAYQLVAETVFPWFADRPSAAVLVHHLVFFGLPLGLAYAAAHRYRARLSGGGLASA